MVIASNVKLLVFIQAGLFVLPSVSFSETWIERSNQVSKDYSLDNAERYPEEASTAWLS